MNTADTEMPKCPASLLTALKSAFDIRRLVYDQHTSIDFLRGVQYVLDTIEANNKAYEEQDERVIGK